MENRLLSFNEFEGLYESYGFITEAEGTEAPMYTPAKTAVTKDDLASLFGGEVEEAEKTPSQFSAIKKGEKSDRVKSLQKDLKIEADGVFGDSTEKAVKKFQTDNKLTVDGIVGVQTLRKMLELKGDKDPEKTIQTKYVIIKGGAPVINPELLKLYDVTIVNNGQQQYIILIPKKDAAEKGKALQASGAFKGFEWMATGLKYIGKALVYTVTGLAVVGLEMAKSMISGIVSAAKFVAGGLIYAMGATVQGLVNVGKWVKAKGIAVYQKVATTANALWDGFCKGFGIAAKASAQAFTAFMQGVKAVGYTLTGMVLTAWKAIAPKLDAAVKTLVQGAKDAEAFISNGLAWIGKNVKNGLVAMKNSIAAGWNATVKATQDAWNGAKSAAKSAGDSVYKAASDAYNSVSSFFSDMYNAGKKAWESLSEILGADPVFESEGWEEISFVISE